MNYDADMPPYIQEMADWLDGTKIHQCNFDHAALAILISGRLDGLAGRVARLTGSSSKFGVEYDSLADVIAFGLAPGVLIFTWALRPFGRYGWLAAFLYVVCGALRLARFNVQITAVESKRFNGLPIPAAAALVASTVLMFFYIGRGDEMVRHITVLVMVYAPAFLMISNVHYYSFKEFNLSQRMVSCSEKSPSSACRRQTNSINCSASRRRGPGSR